jgi:hypothetical protein
MSYIKLTSTTSSGTKCVRFDTQYTHCEISTSRFDKLQHMLGLYDTITAVTIVIDCPIGEWKITKPLDSIKHLRIHARTKFCGRQEVLPENIWLMFPNLETIITDDVYIPDANLDTLQNLNTFRLIYGPPRTKKSDPKVQDIIQVISNMTTLIDLQILSSQQCHIPDEIFQNNPGLKYIDFNRNTVSDNIPSMMNCRELTRMCINIDVLNNPYILELSGLEQVEINDYSNTPVPDEIFAKPVFADFKLSSCFSTPRDRYANGPYYNKHCQKQKNIGYIPPRKIADGNFEVEAFSHF